MTISADDLAAAHKTVAQARSVRIELEAEFIRNGGWPVDGVDLVIAEHGDKIILADDGKLVGIAAAVEAFKRDNPDLFIVLSKSATNAKLSPGQRFPLAYREVIKARGKKSELDRLTSRALNSYARTGNLNAPYAGPRRLRRSGV